ncbi:MAG: hypothetical protein JWR72_806 [Flavisolibacter sp.]|jgi:hypothetical protein|nr:hypothetical protein [Flavisolibacter sp.]
MIEDDCDDQQLIEDAFEELQIENKRIVFTNSVELLLS